MVKRKRISDVEKWIKEGRGTGNGPEYKPWIKIQDVSSSGRSTRLRGLKTGRQHEFLSDLEKNYFYLSEFSDLVLDIREQFPLLPLEETILIAEELGIPHPKHPQTGEYIVMTTDFFLTVSSENEVTEVARTVKSKDDLINKRIIEKFEIEREYWQRRNVEWAIVTEEEINKTFARNIGYIHSYYDISQHDAFQAIDEATLEDIIFELIKRLLNASASVRTIASQFDKDLHLPSGSGITIFYHLLIRKIIAIDFSKVINLDELIEISVLTERDLKKVKYG
ncbi:TnsA endonuclease N-terminal domain-containing protein [Aneurinibacillus aneurinilyticus]|uniref:TnsA endonuclease N-terminal domain-containing protein n=1 Tax=Aneurinibacillus aneurinilyticus TaxID=1391 RepID=UPI0023F1BF2F|nr:TnsA endonuclease N-terminal domain-containing protein [Aneurinibacillus aneurinilyticus]